jgi:Mycothiol maleylpyruvate isomerase N-terminal domain
LDAIVAAVADQQAELAGLLSGLGELDWQRPSRCEGWTVADVVLHQAQTNDLAVASAQGRSLRRTGCGISPAWLGARCLYAFGRAGCELAGPVAFELRAPSGEQWNFGDDGGRGGAAPLTTIRGEALELCLVAARRASPDDTALRGEGPDAKPPSSSSAPTPDPSKEE